MTRRRIAVLGFVLSTIVCLMFSGSAGTVVDQLGNPVQVPEPVSRLASVYGIGTFYVYALGQADRLVVAWYVGVKAVQKAPAAMLRFEPRLPEILASGDPNIEQILLLDPDLVLADWTEDAEFAAQAALLGIPVIQYEAESPEAVKQVIRITGQALGAEATTRAQTFIADYERVFEVVAGSLESLPNEGRVRVLYVGTGTDQVASGDMYQRYLIEAAGGVSVSADLVGGWNTVGLEQILLWDPDVIIIAPYGTVEAATILGDPDWQAVKAVQAGRVYKMPRLFGPWDTPIPESILGVTWMAEQFYPGMLPLDFDAEVLHFYTEYYGFTLTEDDWTILHAE